MTSSTRPWVSAVKRAALDLLMASVGEAQDKCAEMSARILDLTDQIESKFAELLGFDSEEYKIYKNGG